MESDAAPPRCAALYDSTREKAAGEKFYLPTARASVYVALYGDKSKSAVDINTPQSRFLQDQTLAVLSRELSK